ncbi:MAG: hypothetical protein GC168_06850 [Candidatus Hydrogenedens sp.]|nr:hypothetical protein [Candidatus Hydrogenedens sp.]
MMHIDTSDRTEQRKFGVVVGIAFLLLGLFRWWRHDFESVPYVFFSLGSVLVVLGIVAPPLLKPAFIAWMKLAVVLNWIMTRVFLTVAFFIMITPARYMVQWFGDDPLKRNMLPETDTYWEDVEHQPKDLETFKQMF